MYTQGMSCKLDTPPTDSPFSYPPLPAEPHTTRMIRLLPHEDKNAPIQCEVFNYKLSEIGGGRHLYEALSYVWGSEKKSQSITLNGCTIHVTKNLHTALMHLRNRQLERILWADAISIDQSKTDEKSEQVPLMRSIYALAERVLVWLGDAIEDGDKALVSIRKIAEEQYPNIGENRDICLRLLERAWFRRIWASQHQSFACKLSLINHHRSSKKWASHETS